jgi:hypothetical protein
MNTLELVNAVRDLTFEYQADPISDEYIVSRLNEAYRFAYNHFVKSNEELYGQISLLQVVSGQFEYDMPEELWNKRIETMLIPTPPNESTQPWGWTKVRKAQYSQSYPYQTNRIKTYYPECWSTLNNKIYIFPAPLIAYQAKLIVSRKIPMMGVLGGKITELRNNVIYLDDVTNDARIVDSVGDNSLAFISVADANTGEVKALWSYSAVSTVDNTITLQTSPRKYAKLIKGTTVSQITYTAVTAGTTAGEAISVVYTSDLNPATCTVNGNIITVKLETAVTTADNVVTLVTAAAATLVTAVRTLGLGNVVQVANPAEFLIGGENLYKNKTVDTLPGTQWGSIEIDDLVCFGYATGASIFGESIDTFLTDWAVMRIRGSLNETDPETTNSLKLQLQELTGDLGGRNLGLKINMTERANYGSKTFRRSF